MQTVFLSRFALCLEKVACIDVFKAVRLLATKQTILIYYIQTILNFILPIKI